MLTEPALLFDFKDEVEVSTSPPVSEFVSDAFDSCKINENNLRKEMQQLILDKEHPNTQQGESFASQGGDSICNAQPMTPRWVFRQRRPLTGRESCRRSFSITIVRTMSAKMTTGTGRLKRC